MQRISIPENLKASCKLFLEGTVSGTTAFDSSWAWNNWTLVNSPTTQRSQWYKGFVFNGSSNYINWGVSSSLKLSTISISLWVKWTTTWWYYILAKASEATGWYMAYSVQQSSSVIKLRFKYTSWASFLDITWSRIINDWKYHHIVATYNNGNLKLYVDWFLDTSGVWWTNLYYNWDVQLMIWAGLDSSISGYYPWTVSNILIFNKELSITEILQLYYSFFIP